MNKLFSYLKRDIWKNFGDILFTKIHYDINLNLIYVHIFRIWCTEVIDWPFLDITYNYILIM